MSFRDVRFVGATLSLTLLGAMPGCQLHSSAPPGFWRERETDVKPKADTSGLWRTRQAAVKPQAATLAHALKKYTSTPPTFRHTPAAKKWEATLKPYLPPGFSFALPPGADEKPRRWAINIAVAGLGAYFSNEPAGNVLFFETNRKEANAAGDISTLADDGVSGWGVVWSRGEPQYLPPGKGNKNFLVKYAHRFEEHTL